MNSLARLQRVVVLAVVGCTLPWAGHMLGGGRVFGQRSGDSKLDAKRLSRNRVSEAPRGLKPAAQGIQDIQDIMGIGSTSADRSAAARAVTGPTENLSQIIAGETPATMIVALTPVAEHPDGAYGGGNLSYSAADISGQELTVNAGTTTYWNVQLSNWAPTGLRLRYPQAKIDAQTFSSGAGAPLELPNIPCTTHNDCVNAHGEPRARCASDDTCQAAWINKTRTDGLFFDQIETDCLAAWDVGLSPTGPLFAAITSPNPSKTEFCSEADKGIIYYFGTLALTVPLGAVGTYTIEFRDSDTFAFDDTTDPEPIQIPIGTLASGVLHVALPEGQWWWPPGTCIVEPENLTSSDQPTIMLGGYWPDSCVPNVSQITTDGNNVNFDVVLDYPAGADCPAVITPWSLSATLGPPPTTPANYTVMATLYGDPSIPSVPTAACSFTVAHAHPLAQNRYIEMKVPATESKQTAIEVTLAMLHHTCGPESLNLFAPCLSDAYCSGDTCNAPFAEFEGQKRYLNTVQMCRGGTEDGRGMCRSQDDCDERGLGGTCEQMHTCQGGTERGGKACSDQAACDARMDFLTGVPRGGTCLPSIICQDSVTWDTTFACAVLGCQPEYRDWAGELGGRTLYATGPEIVPGASRYEIALLPASCMGNEASCVEALPLVTLAAPQWGSVDNDTRLNVSDLTRMIDRIKEIAALPRKPETQLQPQQVNPLNLVDGRDLTLDVDALKSLPYPYKTLTPCE